MLVNIGIRTPCSENYSSMSPCSGGRYCLKCEKSVVDLRAMTVLEIESLVSKDANPCVRLTRLRNGQVLNLDMIQYALTALWKCSLGLMIVLSAFLLAVYCPESSEAKAASSQYRVADAPEEASAECNPNNTEIRSAPTDWYSLDGVLLAIGFVALSAALIVGVSALVLDKCLGVRSSWGIWIVCFVIDAALFFLRSLLGNTFFGELG
jgi:hypothetical protein